MAAPRRWRNIAAGLTAAGLGAAILGIVLPPAVLPVDAKIGAMVAGFNLALFCGVWAGVKHAEVRLRDRLGRGEDVLARWRVDPDTWQRFVAHETALRALPDAPTPDLRYPDETPPRGLDVVVGRGAVLVGDELHVVPEHGSPEVVWARLDDARLRLAYVELCLLYHPARVGDAPEHRLLRFPVADGSLGAARAVAAHFARETPQRPGFFHGPGDGSDPEDLSRCWKCGFETHTFRSECPRCGASLQSKRWSRRFGGLLMVLGALLAGGVGFLLWYLLPTLLHPGEDVGGTRFSGTPGQAWMVIGILGTVALFGAMTLGYGAFQLATGRRSRLVVQAIIGLAGAMVLLGMLMR